MNAIREDAEHWPPSPHNPKALSALRSASALHIAPLKFGLFEPSISP
jgi:hypothetical protein